MPEIGLTRRLQATSEGRREKLVVFLKVGCRLPSLRLKRGR